MSWGPPQGPQGYPQQGYGQQPYGYPRQPPPKKGVGAGVIVAIIGAIFALLLVVGGVVAYLVFRSGAGDASSSSSAADADHSDVLKAKAEALLAAVKTGKSKEVEAPLLELVVTPETAKAWFTTTFEPKAADDLYGYWDRQVFPNIADVAGTFKKAISYDRTEVRVTRFTNKTDIDACQIGYCKYRDNGNLAKVFAAMKKPQPLYLVELAEPGSKPGADADDVFFFAEIKGGFAYVGELDMR